MGRPGEGHRTRAEDLVAIGFPGKPGGQSTSRKNAENNSPIFHGTTPGSKKPRLLLEDR